MTKQYTDEIITNAKVGSVAALLAYYTPNENEIGPLYNAQEYEKQKNKLCELLEVENLDIAPFYKDYGDGQKIHAGYVIETPEKIMAVYRGTMTQQEVSNDLDFKTEKTVIGGQEYDIHKGFKKEYNASIPHIASILQKKDPKKPIECCGHSLGGATANILALNMNSLQREVSCVTFGAPRVFSEQSSYQYNAKVKNSIRVADDKDPVTKIPPSKLGYKHTGSKLPLAVSKTYKDGHSMDTYDHSNINASNAKMADQKLSTLASINKYVSSLLQSPADLYKSLISPIKDKFLKFKEQSLTSLNNYSSNSIVGKKNNQQISRS